MYYQQLKEKIKNNTALTLGLDVRFNQAMLNVKKNAGFREQAILEDIQSIELSSHIYPGDKYFTADVYNSDGDGFQFILEHQTDRKNGYKPGDITG